MEADDRVQDPESPPLFLARHVDLDLLDVAHDLLLDPTMDLFPAIEDRLALDGAGGVDLDDRTGGSRDRRGALERRQERFRRQAIRVLYLCNLYESATVRTVRLEVLHYLAPRWAREIRHGQGAPSSSLAVPFPMNGAYGSVSG